MRPKNPKKKEPKNPTCSNKEKVISSKWVRRVSKKKKQRSSIRLVGAEDAKRTQGSMPKSLYARKQGPNQHSIRHLGLEAEEMMEGEQVRGPVLPETTAKTATSKWAWKMQRWRDEASQRTHILTNKSRSSKTAASFETVREANERDHMAEVPVMASASKEKTRRRQK